MKHPDPHTASLPLDGGEGRVTTRDAYALLAANDRRLARWSYEQAMQQPPIALRLMAEDMNRRRSQHEAAAA